MEMICRFGVASKDLQRDWGLVTKGDSAASLKESRPQNLHRDHQVSRIGSGTEKEISELLALRNKTSFLKFVATNRSVVTNKPWEWFTMSSA